MAAAVEPKDALAPYVDGAGMGVGVGQDVAAETKRAVVDAHLPEQRGAKVGLVHQGRDAARRSDSPARPYQGDVTLAGVVHAQAGGIVDAVVGEENHECIVPLRQTAQAVNELADAIVEIGHCVGYRVACDAGIGHTPWLVACQGEETRMPGAVLRICLDHLQKAGEGYAVRDAPTMGGALGGGEGFVAKGMLVARSAEIAVRAREINVAAIEKFRLIAHRLQRTGNGGQAVAARGHLHNAHVGKGGVTAERTYGAAVCAEGVGIAIGEDHTLASQLVEPRRDIGVGQAVNGIHKYAAATLHNDKEHVGTGGAQQGVGGVARRGVVQICKEPSALLLGEDVVLAGEILRLEKGRDHAENGIDGTMIEVEAVAIINHADIGRTAAHATADGEKEEATHEEHEGGAEKAVARSRFPLGQPWQTAKPDKNEGSRQQSSEQHERDVGGRHAVDGSAGLAEVIKDRAVQLNAPKSVQAGIAHEDGGQQQGDKDKVRLICYARAYIIYMVYALALAVEVGSTGAPYPVLRNPDTQELKQPDGRSEIACRSQVERKAMHEHRKGICRAHRAIGRHVEGHKTQFGRHEDDDQTDIEF